MLKLHWVWLDFVLFKKPLYVSETLRHLEYINTICISFLGLLTTSWVTDTRKIFLFLIFQRIVMIFSTVVVQIHIPTKSVEGSLFSIPSPAFVICGLINHGHSDWYEVIPHSSFDLHFSNNQGC